MNTDAKRILETFGGLKIIPLKTNQDAYAAEILNFDPILAASGDFDRIDYWQRCLGTRLSPIAEIGGGAVLLLADDGRVFSCRDEVLWFDGSTFEEALETSLIVAKRRPTEFVKMANEVGEDAPRLPKV